MKVSQLPYSRVTVEEVTSVMEDMIARVRNAQNADEILAVHEEYRKLLLKFQTNTALSYMRYSINTVDEFYKAENDYYDEIGPQVQNYNVQLASALLDSPFRAELEEKLSPVLFQSLEVDRKAMSPEIIEDMVEENKLVREYSDLMSGLDFVVPSTSRTTAGGERVFSLRALCDFFADATEQEYKALVYAYLHKEVDKRELSRFVDVSYEEGDKMVYWLKLKKVYDSQGKKRLIALEKLAIVLETLEEEKGYFSENGDDDPFDF